MSSSSCEKERGGACLRGRLEEGALEGKRRSSRGALLTFRDGKVFSSERRKKRLAVEKKGRLLDSEGMRLMNIQGYDRGLSCRGSQRREPPQEGKWAPS